MRVACSMVFCSLTAVCAADVTIRSVPLTGCQRLAVDPITSRIYASVWSTGDPGRANTVTPINPTLGSLGMSIPVGQDPFHVTVSSNGQYLYVALLGDNAVRRVDLATQTAGLQFSLGSDSLGNPNYAEDIAVVPGAPGSVAVSRASHQLSPRNQGVAVYDDGVQRSHMASKAFSKNRIEFGNTNSVLYGLDVETSEDAFSKMSVSSAGVFDGSVTLGVMANSWDFVFDGLMAISNTGVAIDPNTRNVIGQYPHGGSAVISEPSANHVYILGTNSAGVRTIWVYNRTSFAVIGNIDVPGSEGLNTSMVRWGSDGIAFEDRFHGDRVYLVNSSLIPAPPVIACSMTVVIIKLATRRRAMKA